MNAAVIAATRLCSSRPRSPLYSPLHRWSRVACRRQGAARATGKEAGHVTRHSFFQAVVVVLIITLLAVLAHFGPRLRARPAGKRSASLGIVPMEEKKCPYCAEMIKAEAIRCRFCGSDLSATDSTQAPRIAACPRCNVALVQTQVRRFASAGGCLGAVLFLIGIICCLTIVGIIAGVILMALGVIVSAVGGKKTVMICPNCARRGATLSV